MTQGLCTKMQKKRKCGVNHSSPTWRPWCSPRALEPLPPVGDPTPRGPRPRGMLQAAAAGPPPLTSQAPEAETKGRRREPGTQATPMMPGPIHNNTSQFTRASSARTIFFPFRS
jgi:hypothetical protein